MNKNNIALLCIILMTSYKGIAQIAVQTHSVHRKCQDTLQAGSTRKEMEELRLVADQKVTEFLKKRYCIDNNLVSSFPKNTDHSYIDQFSQRNAALGKKTELLNNLVKEPPKADKPEIIKGYMVKLDALIKDIEAGFTEMCQEEKILCGCYSG